MAKSKRSMLPSKPSDLIKLALVDLGRAERMKKYNVDMSIWHDRNGESGNGETCQVCFAGSVIAGTLKADYKKEVHPNSFNKHDKGKLFSLNDFRSGNIEEALKAFPKTTREIAKKKIKLELLPKQISITEYEDDKVEFKNSMRVIIRKLKAVGL